MSLRIPSISVDPRFHEPHLGVVSFVQDKFNRPSLLRTDMMIDYNLETCL